MAKGFNLTAEINLRGPSNIRQVVGGIRKQLQGVNTSLNININKKNIQGINQANSRLAAINKTLQVTTKNAKNATTAFNKLSASMKGVANVKIPNNISSGMNAATKSIQTSSKAIRQAKNEFEEFGKLGGLAIKRFAAFSVVTGAIYSVNNAIAAGVKQFLEYDRQLTRVSQVLNTSRDSLRGLDKTITSLSTSLGVASSDLATVTVTLSQAGIQAADTRKALEALAKSALAPTFDSLTNTTEGAIAAMRQFGITAGQLEGALGSINAVAGSFAVEASDIITAIQRTGGVFASASKGVSQGTDALNEFISVFTSVRATSRESAETIATGLRTIFTRLQRQDTIESLKAFGVTLTDLEGKFVGPFKAIQLLSEGLRSLDTRDLRFAGIAEELGGFRQIGKVLPLIQQFGTAQNALNVAQQGSGSLSRDAAKGQLALAVQIQKVREEFTALVRSISDSTGFRNLLSLGLDLSTVFIRVADSLKGLLPLIAGLGAVKGLSALAGFTKGFGGVFKKSDGGYIHKFARGGVVPGTGNRDTVPAMLQPGEFVIRKKAVESIGTQRLHRMNKYRGGGKVKPNKLAQLTSIQDITVDDGDTFNATVTPTTQPFQASFRLWGYDAYEKGKKQSRVSPQKYKQIQPFNKKKPLTDFPTQDVAIGMGDNIKISPAANAGRGGFTVAQAAAEGTRQLSKKLQGFSEKQLLDKVNSSLTADGGFGRYRAGLGQLIEERLTTGRYEGMASGGSVKDTVPAMLTPGEFVINKKSASQIGSRALHSLNRADKIKGFNRGGFVGLGFENGGGVPARPGTTMATIGISQADVGTLDEVANAIRDLGLTSSSSADLIAQGSQISYEAAMEALATDKMRADAIGANTDAIDTTIKSLRQQGDKVLQVSRALEGASGGDLEKLSGRLNRGQDAGKAAKSLRTKEGGALNNLVQSGQADAAAIKEYIAGARRDRQTLNEMDDRYVEQRRKHLTALGKSDQEAAKIANQEVQLRRQAVDQNAQAVGAKGPGDFGRRLGDLANKSGFAIAALGTFATSLGEATTASEAAFGAAISGGSAAFGAGQIATGAIVDLLPTDALKNLGGIAGTVASAALALGQAFISATNAARQFKIDKAFEDSEKSMELVNSAFDDLEKDINNVNIKNLITDKLEQAGDSLARGLEIQNESAKVFWSNALDVLTTGGSEESVQRAQILEAKGFFAYLKSGFDTQFRQNAAQELARDRASSQAQQFKPIADGINRLIDQRADQGETSRDIINSAQFDSFARSLAMADAQVNAQIQSIQADLSISKALRDAKVREIQETYAISEIRKRVAIVERQKEIEALQKSSKTFNRSLQRLYTNMEQSINATDAALNKMTSQIELTIASLQGQARIGDVVLDAINVLENPRAYGEAERSAAAMSGARLFGSEAANIQGLIRLGENIETAVTSAIATALKDNADAPNAAIDLEINKAVQAELDSLGLPADLSDKMAKEVARALEDITSEGGDQVDYAELSEKLASLNSVIESSTKAREMAIKALEFQQKALNTYTTNLNKIIDIEMSSRNYARKAVDLLADSEIALAKALGKTVNVIDIINNREGEIRRQTGGPISPRDIFDNINRLEEQRRNQQATVDATSQIAGRETDQFIKFNNELKNTSISLRENIGALKQMADNTDVASAALNKIQEAQQTNAQKVGLFEKVVTSTPEELESMQRAFVRLQNNMNGQANTINNSVGAQKAYFEALRSGASGFDAMRAAQAAFAKERGETLGLMKDILPFLGDSEQAGGIRANVLETMLREAGIGVNPMMQQVLNSLRNPATDPAVAAAIQQYQVANNLQADANRLLGQLEADLATEMAAKNERSLRNALSGTTMRFENSKMDDIAKGVNTIIDILRNNNQGQGADGFARGGVVYAATGKEIFKPKGSDTVPAMLTPGEFVVNKKSAQANLPLLNKINTGYYAAGGVVRSNWNNWDPIKAISKQTKEKYVDFGNVEEIPFGQYKDNLYRLPNYTTQAVANSTYTPKVAKGSGRNIADDKPNFTELISDEKRAHYGYGPNFTLSRTAGRNPEWVIDTTYPSDEFDKISRDQLSYAVNGALFTTGKLNQSHISEDRLDDFKANLTEQNKLQFAKMGDLNAISSSLDDSYKTAGAAVGPDAYQSDPIDRLKNIGVVDSTTFLNATAAGNKKSAEDSKTYKVYTAGSYKTVASSTPGPFDDDDNRAGRQQTLHSDIKGVPQYPLSSIFKGEGNAWNKAQFKTLIANHKVGLNEWNRTLGLIAPGAPPPEMMDVRDGAAGLVEKLVALFRKQVGFINLNQAEISKFSEADDFLEGTNPNNLLLAHGNLGKIIKEKARLISKMKDAGAPVPKPFDKSMFSFNAVAPDFHLGFGGELRTFPWVTNISPNELGQEFKDEVEKQRKRQGDDGINSLKLLSPQNLKGKVRLGRQMGDLDYDIPYQVEEYKGKFYKPATDTYGKDIKAWLPFATETNLFRNLETDPLLQPFINQNPLNAKDFNGMLNNAKEGVSPLQLINKYLKSVVNNNEDLDLKNKIKNVTMHQDSLLKFAGGVGVPKFLKKAGQVPINIGDTLWEQVENKLKNVGAAGNEIDKKSSIFQGDNLPDNLLVTATKSLTKSALEIFARKQFTRGLSGFLGRSIGRVPRLDIEDSNEAKSIAGFVSNVFSSVGGYADSAFQKAPNARVAQFIKDAYILASGAWQAFGGIRDGDTNLLNDFNTAANAKGEIPKAYAEGLFRSLGGGAALARIMDFSLPSEYSALLDGKQLAGNMIAKIGPDGSITREPMAEAIPDNVSGLIDLIFNPYNEFKDHLRTKLLEQFQTDLRNLKGGRGLPFFDVNTQGFIDRGIDALQVYYGGAGNWKGFDHLYNGKPEDMAARAKDLLTNLDKSNFQEASAVNAAFGINNKFGPLPGQAFIQGRSIQKRANGGMIYAQNGQLINFQPQGTDTVPAMLTPGEFVINRKATQANLPLLKAINSGERIVPSPFDIGGQVFDDMVTVTNKQALNTQMNSLVENLKKYTSGPVGYQRLIQAGQMGLGVKSAGVGDTTFRGQEGKARYLDGRITFQNERMRGATVRHEYAHAFANSSHDGLLRRFINPGLLGEVQNSNYRQAGDTGYTIEQFAKQPAELFAVLSSIQGGIGPKSQQFLRGSFKALGYQNGGLVGSDGMASLTGYNGKTIKAKLLSVNDRSAVINYQGQRLNVPLNKFDPSTRRHLESHQSWSDHMSNTGDMGMKSRPKGPMLPVPEMFRDWYNNGNGNPRTIISPDGAGRQQGRILEVGPSGIVVESLGGKYSGQRFTLSYDEVDGRTRSMAYELYDSAKRKGRGKEIYSDHLKEQSRKRLDTRLKKLFPGGVNEAQRAEMSDAMTDSELRRAYNRVRNEEAERAGIEAAGSKAAYQDQQRAEKQRRYAESALNDPSREKRIATRIQGEKVYSPSQNNLDIRVAQMAIDQFKKTGLPNTEFNNWLDENRPGISRTRRNIARTMLDQRGSELDERLQASLDDAPPSASEQLGRPSPGAQRRADVQAAGLKKRTERLQEQYDRFEEKYGPEKAAELMEERGFKDGKIVPRQTPTESDFQKSYLDKVWKKYSDSGSPLDPITWAKRNQPGLFLDEARLKSFVERSGHSYKFIKDNPTQFREARMPDNPDGTQGDMLLTVTNPSGLRGEEYSYQRETSETARQNEAKEKGISRWQAGVDYERDSAFSEANWRKVLAKQKELFKTKLRSTIESMPGTFDEYIYYSQEGAVRELSRIVMDAMEQQGLSKGPYLELPGIREATLPNQQFREMFEATNMENYIESQVLKGWMQRKGQPLIDQATDIKDRRLPEAAKRSKDAHNRVVQGTQDVIDSRKRVIATLDKEIAATEDSRGLTQKILTEEKKRAQMDAEHAQRVQENVEDQINMMKREEEIIKKQIEHNKKGEELEKRTFGGVYLSDGGHVDDPYQMTPKHLVGALSSSVSTGLTRRFNPITGRNVGATLGGHTGQVIGEGIDIAAEGLMHVSQHGGGLRGFGQGSVAGYGAMVAGDFAGELASLATNPEAATKRYDAANRRQANQGYLGNVTENLLSPGQAIMQLGREASGLSSDLMKNRQDAMRRNPAASPGRRAQRRQFGGVIYAANGMMVPRGTDTVPAMLTPGEFVVNRRAAQANMPLLNSINNGVQYLHNGGVAGGTSVNLDAFSNVLKTVTDSLNLFNAALIQGAQGNTGGEAGGVNTNGIAAFTQNFGDFIQQLTDISERIPDQIQHTVNGTVNVNVAGGDAFANLAQESINSTVRRQLSAGFDIVEKDTEGQIKNPFK